MFVPAVAGSFMVQLAVAAVEIVVEKAAEPLDNAIVPAVVFGVPRANAPPEKVQLAVPTIDVAPEKVAQSVDAGLPVVVTVPLVGKQLPPPEVKHFRVWAVESMYKRSKVDAGLPGPAISFAS